MSDAHHALDLRALARAGAALSGSVSVPDLERLASDLPPWPDGQPQTAVRWQAGAEWRDGPLTAPGAHAEPELWLHLEVQAELPQLCQRCLQPYLEAVQVDRWFRFVKDEATAEAQDDEAEEDVLVFEPRFDLRALIEDELLLALPLVPMHGVCPQPLSPARSSPGPEPERPHPFAALAALKARPGDDGA